MLADNLPFSLMINKALPNPAPGFSLAYKVRLFLSKPAYLYVSAAK
jgi:hypothetical protein